MMEAVRTSEKSVNIYLTIWQYIPEDSKLHDLRILNPSDTHNSFWYYCVFSVYHSPYNHGILEIHSSTKNCCVYLTD
jgi:hypothetical protein